MPNQPKTLMHGVRVSDELWHAAQEEAAARGETVSEAIRRSLKRYTRARRRARTVTTPDRTDS